MAARRRRKRRTRPFPLSGGEEPRTRSAERPDNLALPENREVASEAGAPGGRKPAPKTATPQERYAALDLGTNNCRLLIASPRGRGFRIFDAFSRIVRLGEGISASGSLSEPAMARTIEALKICADKIERRGATKVRCIATQACRSATNGAAFLERVRDETGLSFEIITPAEEARLSVVGCAELIDADAEGSLIFDIGGGSTEISWVRPNAAKSAKGELARSKAEIAAWASLPIGVVNLSERFGGRDVSKKAYEGIVESIREAVSAEGDPAGMRALFESGSAHFLGTSGTVTSIAGVHLKLTRYRRDAVDGVWLSADEVREVSERLRAMSYEERAQEPCIGLDRADLVVCGCAILEALLREWPTDRIRVADRGLREGVLAGLASEQGARRRRRRRRPSGPSAAASPSI